jgi:hypothetical protein
MLGELEHRSEKQDSTTTELPATALLVYREGSKTKNNNKKIYVYIKLTIQHLSRIVR